jgi:DNA-binding HxlR family transcriptional regulator/DNA-binding NarL/FixJ family response regulator
VLIPSELVRARPDI